MMNISEVNYLDLGVSNFTDITTTLSVLVLNKVHMIEVFQCSMRNITTYRYGKIIEVQTAESVEILSSTFNGNAALGYSWSGSMIKLSIIGSINILSSTFNGNNMEGRVFDIEGADIAHIVSSTFSGNIMDGNVVNIDFVDTAHIVSSTFSGNIMTSYCGYLISIYNSDNVLISCSTIENNTIYGGALVKIYTSRVRGNPYCRFQLVFRYGMIVNSTFRHNNIIGANGAAVDCNICSIISNVFDQNVGNGSFFAITYQCWYNSPLFPARRDVTIDCSNFTNNTMQQFSSVYSTTCNQLLVPGEMTVCQHNSEGKCIHYFI
jgi:hypothetical protein